MKAKNELRPERTDVYSFWVDKKVLNTDDEIEVVEEKVDECTLIELEKRIETHNTAIADLNAKIADEQMKIALIGEL
jgi:hypothetical protein